MGNLIIARNNEVSSASSGNKTDISSAVVTLASGTLTYDGTAKTQAVSSVVLSGTTLVAGTDYVVFNNSRTNAGTYKLFVIGRGDYEGYVSADWSIAKAQGSVSASPSSLTTVGGVGTTATSALTVFGDGTISVQSSDDSVATASISGTIVTVTSVATGSATITVTVAASSNYLSASTTISVAVTIVGALDTCTPDVIQAVAQAGAGASAWSVGDKTASIIFQNVTVGALSFNGLSACAFIIGFDHNNNKEGTGIHFQVGMNTNGIKTAFCDSNYGSSSSSASFHMNQTNINSGGWNSSYIRSTICSAFLSALPNTWQNVIAFATKYTDNTGGGSDTASYVTNTSDKIWLLAEYEVQGAKTYANSAEQNNQAQYDYYKNGNTKVFYKHDSLNTACVWWLRSPNCKHSQRFCLVQSSGNAGGSSTSSSARYSQGFAPGFKIA